MVIKVKKKPFCYHDGRNIVDKEFAHHSDVFPLYTSELSNSDCHTCAGRNIGDMALQLSAVLNERDEYKKVLQQYHKLTCHDGWYADMVKEALSKEKNDLTSESFLQTFQGLK